MGLCVEGPVLAAKVIRSRGGAGFEERAFKFCEPKLFLSGVQGRLFNVAEKSFFVVDPGDGDAAESPEDALGKRRMHGIFIQIDMIDLGNLF